jgi:hypothetical protein
MMAYSTSYHATYTESLINMPYSIKKGVTKLRGRCLVQVLLLSNDRKLLLQ